MSIQNPIIATDGRDTERDREFDTTEDQSFDDVEDTETRARDQRDLQTTATPTAKATSVDGDADSAAPYLPGQTSSEAGDRWKRVQAEFVDDPRQSVSEAHKLVSDLMQQIVDAFSKERDNLEHQWSQGDSVSTEDLRVCLQRYRAFFSRLLPSARGLDKAS